ncbi:MAG TPA: RNA polymerase sigma factor [Planctomycetota bacterium]|nr:RNA polymerase sigma factor [Planctomycetota bacterium]
MPPASDAPEDIDLRDRILAGDEEGAEELFQRHFDALYEFVYYRVGCDRTAAESVVQDTLHVAFEKLTTFEGRSSLHTWLCGIAKNRIRTERRTRRRSVPLDDLLASADSDIQEILLAVEEEELPTTALERQETRDLVGATLSSLPPEYRRALIEKYVDGLSVAQMAVRGGRGGKATESLLHRSRTAFVRVFKLLAGKRWTE